MGVIMRNGVPYAGASEDISNKMDKADPTGTGVLSINRKANTTVGFRSAAIGYSCTASGDCSFACGYYTTASNGYSFSCGYYTTASGSYSFACGNRSTASAQYSVCFGKSSTASHNYSFAFGDTSTSSAAGSWSIGYKCDANAASSYSFVFGSECYSHGTYGIAIGSHCTIDGGSSCIAMGFYASATNMAAVAIGGYVTANAQYSQAMGRYTIANHHAQHVFGEYNIEDPSTTPSYNRGTYLEIVGNGTADDARSNARTLDWSGNEVLAGTIEASGFGATLLNLIYPVGSIYMSVNNTNPGTYLTGTTWVAWGSGRVPVGVSSDTEFNTVEKTGGAKTHTHDVGLRLNGFYYSTSGLEGASGINGIIRYDSSNNISAPAAYTSPSTVSSFTVNNSVAQASKTVSSVICQSIGNTSYTSDLQPYITCYMWKRTA